LRNKYINKNRIFISIDRDLNAAINILDCFILPTRSMMLCRVEVNKKLEKI